MLFFLAEKKNLQVTSALLQLALGSVIALSRKRRGGLVPHAALASKSALCK